MKTTIIMLFSFLIGGNILHAQNDFSVNYRHDRDSWTYIAPEEELCKTTFIREKVVGLLRTEGISYVQVGFHIAGETPYFSLHAMDANGKDLRHIIGDYPCPDDCLPPETLAMMKNNSLSTIPKAIGYCLLDIEDINNVLGNDPQVTYLIIRKGLRQISIPGLYFISHIVYGAEGQLDLDDPNSIIERKNPGQPVYISIE